MSINGKDGFVQFASSYGQGYLFIDLILYDWHVAAAEVWDKKASHRFAYINVKAGDHKFDAEQEYTHCVQQRDYHRSKRSMWSAERRWQSQHLCRIAAQFRRTVRRQ